MLYRALADGVVALHLAYLGFVAVGALLAWRWRWLVWLHVPSTAWGLGMVTVGMECPLTSLERWLRERRGEGRYEEGFVDRYLEDVLFPDDLTPVLWVAALLLITAGYVGIARRRSAAARV